MPDSKPKGGKAGGQSRPRKASGLAALREIYQTVLRVQQAEARQKAQAEARKKARQTAQETTPSAPSDAHLFRRAVKMVTPLRVTPLHRAGHAAPQTTPQPAAPSPEQLARRRAALGDDAQNASASTSKPAPGTAPTVSDQISHQISDQISDHYAPHLPAHWQRQHGLAWCVPDQPADTLARLQRGHWPVTARLDLHGLRQDAARAALAAFLTDCAAHRVRCARVIHGQGHSSTAPPVLRDKTPAWLAQHPTVCAFVQAPASAGGAGAVLVLLH